MSSFVLGEAFLNGNNSVAGTFPVSEGRSKS